MARDDFEMEGGDTPLRTMVVMVVSYLELPNKGQGKACYWGKLS